MPGVGALRRGVYHPLIAVSAPTLARALLIGLGAADHEPQALAIRHEILNVERYQLGPAQRGREAQHQDGPIALASEPGRDGVVCGTGRNPTVRADLISDAHSIS